MNLEKIVQDVQQLTQGETVAITLAESDGTIMYYATAIGKHATAIVGKRGETAKTGLCGTFACEGQPVLVCQTLGDNRVRQDMAEAFGTKTALAVPVYQEGKLFAVLMVLNRLDGQLLNKEVERTSFDYYVTDNKKPKYCPNGNRNDRNSFSGSRWSKCE
jgi:GAF domain-containing protein